MRLLRLYPDNPTDLTRKGHQGSVLAFPTPEKPETFSLCGLAVGTSLEPHATRLSSCQKAEPARLRSKSIKLVLPHVERYEKWSAPGVRAIRLH